MLRLLPRNSKVYIQSRFNLLRPSRRSLTLPPAPTVRGILQRMIRRKDGGLRSKKWGLINFALIASGSYLVVWEYQALIRVSLEQEILQTGFNVQHLNIKYADADLDDFSVLLSYFFDLYVPILEKEGENPQEVRENYQRMVADPELRKEFHTAFHDTFLHIRRVFKDSPVDRPAMDVCTEVWKAAIALMLRMNGISNRRVWRRSFWPSGNTKVEDGTSYGLIDGR